MTQSSTSRQPACWWLLIVDYRLIKLDFLHELKWISQSFKIILIIISSIIVNAISKSFVVPNCNGFTFSGKKASHIFVHLCEQNCFYPDWPNAQLLSLIWYPMWKLNLPPFPNIWKSLWRVKIILRPCHHQVRLRGESQCSIANVKTIILTNYVWKGFSENIL